MSTAPLTQIFELRVVIRLSEAVPVSEMIALEDRRTNLGAFAPGVWRGARANSPTLRGGGLGPATAADRGAWQPANNQTQLATDNWQLTTGN
jgi:hypothetical protein